MELKIPGTFAPGRFLARLNRFVAQVEIDGEIVTAHVPTSGRLGELLLPGAQVQLRKATKSNRKTPWDMMLVKSGKIWVSLDSRLPNYLVGQLLRSNGLPPFAGATDIRAECAHGAGRLDFCFIDGSGRLTLLEVKSVTLVEGKRAMFPDAPSGRGERHVGELADAVREGYRAAVVFIIQREDAKEFTPNRRTDPAFAAALHRAAVAGVEVHAWRCRAAAAALTLLDKVPVLM